MKQYPIAMCFLALFVASCTEDVKPNVAEPQDPDNVPVETEKPAKGMKTFRLELPDVGKDGTPVPVILPNLDPLRIGYNTVFEAPEGVSNIALKKPVTTSDEFPVYGEIEMVTDGSKLSNDYLELPGGLQWVQIDLQKSSEIFAIAVWHFQAYRAYKDVVIRVSDDSEFKDGVETVFNNDEDNSAGFGAGTDQTWEENHEGRLIIMQKPVKARYVRLYSDGNTQSETNAYTEVEVYGR